MMRFTICSTNSIRVLCFMLVFVSLSADLCLAQTKNTTEIQATLVLRFTVSIQDGEDWTLPSTVSPAPGSGFFSEDLDLTYQVGVRSFDVSWRQLNPSEGVYDFDASGSAQGMVFPSYNQQFAQSDPFWMRIWASGVDWAPGWVMTDCGISETWEDYDGQFHMPIWNTCVWNHLMTLYRHLFITQDLRSDPRLIMLYTPGAFTWCEFDYEIIDQAAGSGLTFETFNNWFQPGMVEMVDIFNGENASTADDYASKLVFTGEDYPWGPWNGQANLLARDAVLAGQGIRTGITELFNFHLNHTPAYGASIAADGHIVVNESWPLLHDGRILATENECFNACGFSTSGPSELWYAVKMANLKALQLRVNWLYVVPSDSYMAEYPAHWEWVRLSLGHTPQTSPDAWVALREFQDLYWQDDNSHTWSGKPWIHNFERWLIQKDLGPDGTTVRGSEIRSNVLGTENGTAYEGRRTDLSNGQNTFYFFVEDLFHQGTGAVDLKVTYLDTVAGQWSLEYQNNTGIFQAPSIVQTGTNTLKTATFHLNDAHFSNGLAQGSDFRIISTGSGDIELRFVRIIKVGSALQYDDWPSQSNILDFVQSIP